MPSKPRQNFAYEISAGAILFQGNGERLYLLLHYGEDKGRSKRLDDDAANQEYWGFPKGHVDREKKESLEHTALREIEEETGLKPAEIELVPGFKKKIHYFFRRGETLVSKDAVYFLARAKKTDVRISWEHVGFAWLPFSEAVERIKYKGDREILIAANNYLTESDG
jgi:8-oxo-dGTP pyrophosphatase MutT (NUDIX family)